MIVVTEEEDQEWWYGTSHVVLSVVSPHTPPGHSACPAS